MRLEQQNRTDLVFVFDADKDIPIRPLQVGHQSVFRPVISRVATTLGSHSFSRHKACKVFGIFAVAWIEIAALEPRSTCSRNTGNIVLKENYIAVLSRCCGAQLDRQELNHTAGEVAFLTLDQENAHPGLKNGRAGHCLLLLHGKHRLYSIASAYCPLNHFSSWPVICCILSPS
jgi:hypothetical protein